MINDIGSDVTARAAPARTTRSTHWWHEYRHTVPREYLRLIEKEADAERIVHFHSAVVPGLLQTAEYARAVTLATMLKPITRAESEHYAGVRLRRQRELLENPSAVDLTFLLDESAIRRRVGTAEIMRRQLVHLQKMIAHPNVTLILLPLGGPVHTGHGVAGFMLLHSRRNDSVFFEGPTGTLAFDRRERPDLVAGFARLAERLTMIGLQGAAAVRLLESCRPTD